MSSGSERLAVTMKHLVEMTDHLTEVLQRYKTSSMELAARVERGETLEAVFPAIQGPARPREVTEVLVEFEAARHQVRMAMLELGGEQGITISEMGRQLGLSRQLASRLAAESRATQK